MSAAAKNRWESQAREAKKAALVAQLDALLTASEVHPHGAQACEWVASLAGADWRTVAEVAAVKPPSIETVRQIVALYKERPVLAAAVKRMGARR